MGAERFVWYLVPVGAIVGGVCMVIWPAGVVLQNRDDAEDTTPPTAAEIWWTRLGGIVALVVGLYMLYRMLGGTWGAGEGGDSGLGLI